MVEAHPPPQQHHAPPPRRPIFALVGVWMGASMEWHRGGDTGFEGLVRAVQSTENVHFNEASESSPRLHFDEKRVSELFELGRLLVRY